jgi:cell division cycle 14
MIKNCGFGAREAIAWTRLCRPGSVIGPQQLFLLSYEDQVRAGTNLIAEPHLDDREIPMPVRMRKICFSPMKGFPMDEENGGPEEDRPRTARRSARISRPFATRKSDRFQSIMAMPIASVHPQPRKINQRPAPKFG